MSSEKKVRGISKTSTSADGRPIRPHSNISTVSGRRTAQGIIESKLRKVNKNNDPNFESE
jgi:hypothetical protein